MKVDYILLSVPGFFALMGLEAWLARRKPVYALNDTLSNLACGIGSQLTGLLFGVLALFGYGWLFEHARLVDLTDRPWVAWGVGLVGVDLIYYWWHRASHRTGFFWATHVVHHQSEEYNLSVALRQSWFAGLFSWFFYLPLALLGVPYEIYLANASLSLLYQFWIHTKAIRRLGPLEWVMNTPSHHRVHHASNPAYLDRNYAATFIVWDRLFGTFAEEREVPVYGVVHPLRSWDSIRANFTHWFQLGSAARRLSGMDKFRVWVKEPGWQPTGAALGGTSETSPLAPAGPAMGWAEKSYALFQFLQALGASITLIYARDALPPEMVVLLMALVFGIFVGLGQILDEHPGAWIFERVRITIFLVWSGLAYWRGGSAVSAEVLAYAFVTWVGWWFKVRSQLIGEVR